MISHCIHIYHVSYTDSPEIPCIRKRDKTVTNALSQKKAMVAIQTSSSRPSGALRRTKDNRTRNVIARYAAAAAIIILSAYIIILSACIGAFVRSDASSPSVGAGGGVSVEQHPDPRGMRGKEGGGYAGSSAIASREIKDDGDTERDESGSVRATVGYVVTITGCGSDPLVDGAAVLAHSIRLSSASNPSSGSRYGYEMYALVHPDAVTCAPLDDLRKLGYEVLVRGDPVPLGDIRGEYLRENVVNNGCCGEKEFLKLHAYGIVGHPVVVHLDLDTLVLRPLDELFDSMLLKDDDALTSEKRPDLPTHAGKTPPTGKRPDAFFTRDYNMVKPGRLHTGVQGGFLVLRPSLEAYQNFVDIITEGDFRSNGGWGGKGFGPFYGSMTFQGIIPYYYDELHPGTAVELNRCVYNQMCDNPRVNPTVNDVVSGQCRDGRDECEDCRSRPLLDVRTAHFTLCQKPWRCMPHSHDRIQDRLCRKLHGEWYRIRADMELMWGRDGGGEGNYQKDHFRGFCKSASNSGYIPVTVPEDLNGHNPAIAGGAFARL